MKMDSRSLDSPLSLLIVCCEYSLFGQANIYQASTVLSIVDRHFRVEQDICPRLVSSVMWHPRSNERYPNPWFDVANFVPSSNGSDKQKRRYPFTSLPTELGQYIARLLPKESAAALALTSKAMNKLVPGQLYKDLNILERWRLILLLERDSDLLIACQQCMTLHSPFTSRRNGFLCQRQWKSLLPDGITPALCRLLAKRYIRQETYTDLLSIAARTEVYTVQDFKVFSNTTLRMINGNLFVRLETSIAPLTVEGNLTSSSAYQLNNIISSSGSQVCPHVRWQHLGLELSRGPRSDIDRYSSLSALYLSSQLSNQNYLRDQLYGNDPLKDQLYKLDHKRKDPFVKHNQYTVCTNSRCLAEESLWLGHTADCYDSTPVPHTILENALGPGLKCALFHSQPCKKPICERLPARFRVNPVRACEICATDMCVSAQDVGGVGRVISLTTWKNLGGVYGEQWMSWYPHSTEVGRFTRDFIVGGQTGRTSRSLGEGATVYAGFENLPDTEPVRRYTPSISGRMINIFTREPIVQDRTWFGDVSILGLSVV